MSNEYTHYPHHPLYGIDTSILEVAREVMRGAAEWKDVAPDMVEPLADAVVMALRMAGFINEEGPPIPPGPRADDTDSYCTVCQPPEVAPEAFGRSAVVHRGNCPLVDLNPGERERLQKEFAEMLKMRGIRPLEGP